MAKIRLLKPKKAWPSLSPDDKAKNIMRPLLLCAIAGVMISTILWSVYHPVLSCQAQYMDDIEYYVNNPLVQDPSWHSVGIFLGEVFHPTSVSGYYQPLSMISLMLDFAVGAQPFDLTVFHQTSLVLHILNTVLVMLFLYQLFGNFWIAGLMSLLFGLHPITIESIAWVSDRKTLLTAFFSLVSLNTYLQYTQKKTLTILFVCLLAYGLAILSKPTSIILPFVLLVLDWGFLDRVNRSSIIEKIPFFALSVLISAITFISQYASVNYRFEGGLDIWKYPLVIFHNFFFYLRKVLLPVDLPQYYPYPAEVLSSAKFYIFYTVLVVSTVTGLCCSLRWTRQIAASMLFYLVAILPAAQFIRYTHMGASDKYAYFPTVGIILAICVSACLVSRHIQRSKNIIVAMIACASLILITEAILVRKCLRSWQDTVTLYTCLIQKNPNQSILYNNLGLEYKRLNEHQKAVDAFSKAIEINPIDVTALNNYAMVLKSEHQYVQAESCLKKALRLAPNDAVTLCNLGTLYEFMDQTGLAEDYYKKAIELYPNLTEARLGYANLLTLNGDFGAASEQYQLFEGRTKPPAYFLGLGILYFHQRNYSASEIHLKAAIELAPSLAQASFYLGRLYQQQNNSHQAIQQFYQAVRLDPSIREAWVHLGDLYLSCGSPVNAAACYQEALKIRSDDTGILCRLTILYATTNHEFFEDKQKAVEYGMRACELSNHENPGILDIMAVAYAACGNYDKAVEIGEKACRLADKAGASELMQEIQSRLDKYRGVLCKKISDSQIE